MEQVVKTAIIGGSGLGQLDDMEITHRTVVRTPYGDPSGIIIEGNLFHKSFLFLPRHGAGHTIAPHNVNYRANIWALKQSGVKQIIGFAAVGGIRSDMVPGSIAIPDQLVDYTWGRAHTFFDGSTDDVQHIDFSEPYTQVLRSRLLAAASATGTDIIDGGTYGITQGPRLETPAEIDRLERDGVDMVGMTGMPEAALAREVDIDYACIAIIVNPAAGRSSTPITMDTIGKYLHTGVGRAVAILNGF